MVKWLETLPSSISTLSRLETLDLRSDMFNATLRISNAIWNLQSLRRCSDSSLLRLDGLNKLEILDRFNNEYCVTKHLSTLTNLRSLTAVRKDTSLDNDGLQEFITQVSNLKHLQFLSLQIFGGSYDLSLVEDMFSLACLAHLEMHFGSIRALPEYRDGFGLNLLSLVLNIDGMETDPFSTLEKLPNLKTLTLILFAGGN